jgi:type II secretory pathway pseudopilin PulG
MPGSEMQSKSAVPLVCLLTTRDSAPAGRHARTSRQGVTLLELLIVILVMLMITALTIPVVAPALSGRQIREAARMVDVFINGARNRAFQTGRPVGVVFEQDIPGGATTLSYAEVPPPYSGDQSNSTINITQNGATDVTSGYMFNQQDMGWYGLVRPGDLIQFNYRPTLYRIYAGEPFLDVNYNGQYDVGEPYTDTNLSTSYDGALSGTIQANGYLSSGSAMSSMSIYNNGTNYFGAWTYAYADPTLALQYMSPTGGFGGFGPSGAVTFQIVRQPVPLATGKLQLSSAAAIDMGATIGTSTQDVVAVAGSGFDVDPPASGSPSPPPGVPSWSLASFREFPMSPLSNATVAPAPYTSRVIVTFSPSGLVDLVYCWDEPTFSFNNSAGGWQGRQPTGPIYFLVGKRELVGGDPEVLALMQAGQAPIKPCFNYQDATNLWVVINPFTGMVSTTENAPVDLTAAPPVQNSSNQTALQTYYSSQAYQARSIAREMQNTGGR